LIFLRRLQWRLLCRSAQVSPARLHNGVAFFAPRSVTILGVLRYSRFMCVESSVYRYRMLTAAALISGTNNSTIGSPSYPNATSSINDTTAASTTTVSFVNGSAAVQSCYLDWASWILADAEWFVSEVFGDEFVTVTSETITSIVYSTYKLCDGIPRAVLDGDLNYTTVTISQDFVTPPISYTYESILSPSLVVLSTVTITEAVIGPVSVRSLTTTFDEPLPTCIIAPSDCASLYVESSNAMFTGGGINYTASPPLFACATVFDEYLPRTDYSCVVDIPVVQLI